MEMITIPRVEGNRQWRTSREGYYGWWESGPIWQPARRLTLLMGIGEPQAPIGAWVHPEWDAARPLSREQQYLLGLDVSRYRGVVVTGSEAVFVRLQLELVHGHLTPEDVQVFAYEGGIPSHLTLSEVALSTLGEPGRADWMEELWGLSNDLGRMLVRERRLQKQKTVILAGGAA